LLMLVAIKVAPARSNPCPHRKLKKDCAECMGCPHGAEE
jgi:hypothetical protein